MEYISSYLRRYADMYWQEGAKVRIETVYSKPYDHVTTSLPIVLNEAANQIDNLKKRIKELEYIQRIIDVAKLNERK